mgnify:FL=1
MAEIESQENTPTTTGSIDSLHTKNNSRYSENKKVIIACLATAFIVFLLSAGGMAGAFLLGRSYNARNLDEKRQTVVQEGEVIEDVAQKMGPSVVSIVTEQQSTINSLFYGARTQTSKAAGTGLILDENGLILTNKHVVPEGTSAVEVVTSNGVSYKDVQIIGRDPLNDLAVLKVSNPKNFSPARLGDSEKVRTGQKVIAIGNALGQFQNTVTSGIISGMGRPIEAGDESGSSSEQLTNLFQTDAAINSGNSGGPLLNFNGEVIGINTAIAQDAENIGFAIPINEAKGIIESVKTSGKLSRPYIGVKYSSLNTSIAKQLNISVTKGAYIDTDSGSVVSGSPAEKAGLKGGDVITKVNDITLSDTISLTSAVGRFKVGDDVTLTVVRDGKTIELKVKLVEAPSS